MKNLSILILTLGFVSFMHSAEFASIFGNAVSQIISSWFECLNNIMSY